jgi:hypothetical protein
MAIFGFTLTTDPLKSGVAFVIMVGYIIATEFVLDNLDKSLKRSTYREVMKKFYMELVILGLSTFILTVVGYQESEWSIHVVGFVAITK